MQSELNNLDLFYIFKTMIDKKWAVLSTIFTCIIITIIFLKITTHEYEIKLKLMPVEDELGGTNISAGGLGSLAALGGINIDDNKLFAQYKEMLFSGELAKRLLGDERILKVAFRKYWNEEKNKWQEPDGSWYKIKKILGQVLFGKPKIELKGPTSELLVQYLRNNVIAVRNNENGILTLIIYNEDKDFGKYILQKIHLTADQIIKKKKIARTKDYIKYINEKLLIVKSTEHRQTLVDNLIRQEHTLMMASSDLPFSAESFGAPEVSPTAERPNITLSLISSIIIGSFLGVFVALYISAADRNKVIGSAS